MQPKSRTTYIETLHVMRRNPDLSDAEKEKIIQFLASDLCKNHMAETGMKRSIEVKPRSLELPITPAEPPKPDRQLSKQNISKNDKALPERGEDSLSREQHAPSKR